MTNIVDRRTSDNTATNKQRFYRRVKDAVNKTLIKKDQKMNDKDGKVVVPKDYISEPEFQYDNSGVVERVLPGNDKYKIGDRESKQNNSESEGGMQASDSGKGVDDFIFNMPIDDAVKMITEDLELPNLVKTGLDDVELKTRERAGFAVTGSPSNLDIIKTSKNAIGRRLAFRGAYQEQINELEQQLCEFERHIREKLRIKAKYKGDLTGFSEKHKEYIWDIQDKINELEKKRDNVPYIDDVDVRFKAYENKYQKMTKVVFFCLMDVSGSMSQERKDIAKKFYILTYRFLKLKYKSVEVVFIRYHTEASICTEEEFFYSPETGGTLLSKGLNVLANSIKNDYSNPGTNIYVMHTSDGENHYYDNSVSKDILLRGVMPFVQQYYYINLLGEYATTRAFAEMLEEVYTAYPNNLDAAKIENGDSVSKIFRYLFRKRK